LTRTTMFMGRPILPDCFRRIMEYHNRRRGRREAAGVV
jgi:hypothetical protein